jgi:hypothetical protein
MAKNESENGICACPDSSYKGQPCKCYDCNVLRLGRDCGCHVCVEPVKECELTGSTQEK